MIYTREDSWSWRLRSCHALMHKPSFVFVSGCEGWHEEGGASEAISEAISSGFSSKEVCNWVLMCRRPHRVSCIPTIPNSGRTFGFISLFELSVILASCWQGPLKRDFLYWKKRWLSISPCCYFAICKSRMAFLLKDTGVALLFRDLRHPTWNITYFASVIRKMCSLQHTPWN